MPYAIWLIGLGSVTSISARRPELTTRRDFQQLSEARLRDACILYENNRDSSAYYLAGYSIEFALKACISRQFRSDEIPEKSFVHAIHTHNPNDLMKVSGLAAEFKDACNTDSRLAASWGIVCNWSESSRYANWDHMAAASLLQSITDEKSGVLQWLKKHW
jgi:hypothetical protein